MQLNTNLTFKLEKEIGQEGKQSHVFEALDHQLNAKIAVKRISKAKFKNTDEYFKEATQLYDSEHQNVVQIKYACQDNYFIFITMPIYKNGSISNIMKIRYLTVREIIRYSLDFLSGLNHIHTKKLIHFDIKPNNILISNNGSAILSDFGLAKYMDNNGLAYNDMFYSYHRPPEALLSSDLDISSDIFQVGLTLYRMANGDSNFKYSGSDLNKDIIDGKFPNRNFFLPHIPKKLRKIINKCLEIDTTRRYNNVLDIMNDLANVDENLDWRYNLIIGFQELTFENDSKIEKILINEKDYSVITNKEIKLSGNKSKVNSGCKNDCKNLNESFKFIETFLKKI